MRYEDSSQSESINELPVARDDTDALAAGTRGPATGNVVTGTGTQSGALGADLAVDGAQITSISGAGGADTTLSGGRFEAAGEFGQLSIDPQGNYRYLANQGAPENSRDHFTYKLTDAQGDSDNGILTIEIGKSQSLGESQMVVPGPDGVVLLPPGVELSDVRVVGRNLVIDLPDGTQMVIVDGAVFVPQLVIDNVQVPATNLAALLIDSEPTPAAGGQPPSGGGNFEVEVGPLDPGVPLGDLIPPTELAYIPPEFDEPIEFVDDDIEVVIRTPDQPAGAVDATDSVNEAGLPARPVGEPDGSGEEAAAGTNGDTSESTTGTIDIDAPDGLDTVTINGTLVSGVLGQSFAGAFGTLTITSIVGTEIGYSYTLNDNTSGNDTEDFFSVVVTDDDGDSATATLTIDIVDDVPTARPDTDSIAAGQFGPATGNVMTDAAAGDIGDSDTNARDTVGADDASLTSVSGSGGSDSTFNEAGNLVVNGQYGVLTINADGDYSYVRGAGTPGGVTDVFNYTLTDGDGDTSTSTLTISIGNATPDAGQNPTVLLDDDALANGNPGGVGDDPDAANTTGTLSGAGGDGALTFDLQTSGAPAGFTYVDGPNGSILVQQGGTTVLTVTINAATGAYTVTQNAPIDHAAGGNENNVGFTIGYTVTDVDGGSDSGSLTINVDDDTPTISRTDRPLPTLTVDETDLALNASANFSVLFDGRIGADLPGSLAFSLSVVNGADSGTVDVATGQGIFLFNNGGVIEARVGGSDGPVAYVISVDSATGVVSVDQIRALSHPDASNPDDSVSPTPTAIQLIATVTDGDGDAASLAVNIGGQIVFEDDGPTITSGPTVGSSVLLDETDGASPLSSGAPISATSESAVIVAAVDFGADVPGSTVYGLSLLGNTTVGSSIASGLATAVGDLPITLTLTSSTLITGSFAGGIAFTIQMNANGTITVTQFTALEHLIDGSTAAAHDDPLSLVNGQLQSLVNATVTYRDADGDTVSAAVGIGAAITFEDDGPSIDVIITVPTDSEALAALSLTTGDNGTEGAGQTSTTNTSGFGGMFTLAFDGGADGAANTPDINYSLGLLVAAGTATGLESNGQAINLYIVGGVVVGATSAPATATSPSVVFSLSIDSEGAVTLTQFQQIDHNPESPSGAPFADQLVALGAGFVEIIASSSIIDQDGDTASDSERFDFGAFVRFADDGPDISAALVGGARIRIDETDGVVAAGGEVDPLGGNLGTVTMDIGTLFTVSTVAPSADSPTTLSYALTLGTPAPGLPGVNSGLLLSSNNAIIYLYNNGGTIIGSTALTLAGANAANTAFTVSISADGDVTLTQFLAVEHFNTGNHDEDSSGLTLGALLVRVTATDFDGDTDVASVDLGSIIRFEDDGPNAADDTDTIASGTVGPATGNVITDAAAGDALDGDTGADSVGADGGAAIVGLVSVNVPANSDNDPAGGFVVAGAFGTLTMQADGNYSYLRNAGQGAGQNEVFTYTLTDADGDTTTATLTIAIANATLTLVDPAAVLLDDDALDNGNAGGVDDDTNSSGTPGQLVGSGGDGDLDYAFTGLNTLPAGFTVNVVNAGQIQILQGATVVLTVNLNNEDGSYSVVQNNPIIHPEGSNENNVSFNIGVQAVDADGDVDGATITINVDDDTPFAADDTDTIASGTVGPATGNVITDAAAGDALDGDTGADSVGADGGAAIVGLVSVNVPANSDNDPAGGFVVAGAFGTLTMQADGNYSYLRNAGQGAGQNEVFTYTLTDADGDTTTATLTIAIANATLTLVDPAAVLLDDDALDNGNAGGVDDDTNSSGTPGQLVGSGGDGDLDYAFTGLNTLPAGFTVNVVNAGQIQILQGATVVLTVNLNNEDGSYSVVQNNPIIHPEGSNENNVSFNIGVQAVDADGDVDGATITINVDDDTPFAADDTDTIASGTVGPATGNVITDAAAGDALDGDTGADSVGADGGAAIVGLVSVNVPANSDNDPAGGFVVAGAFGTLTMQADGNYSYLRNAGQGAGQNEVFTYTLTDADGDTTTATLTIAIANATLTLVDPAAVLLDDDALDNGNAGGVDDDTNSSGTPGQLVGSGGDGDLDYAFTGLNTLPAGFTVNVVNAGQIQILQGATVVLTVNLNNEDGSYSVVQNNPIIHPEGSNENNVSFNIGVQAVDADGDVDGATITINVDDDTPFAADDTDTIASGTVGPATGNVITDAAAGDALDGDTGADSVGADGGAAIVGLVSVNVPANSDNDPAGGFVVAGAFGTLTMQADGNYSYLRNAGQGAGQNEVFTYTLTDADGDTTTATLTIAIANATLTLVDPAAVLLDDDALDNGNAGGVDDDTNSSGTPGQLVGSGGDGDLDYAFTGLNTLPAGFTVNVVNAGQIQILQGATVVLTVNLNNEDGSYSVVQNNPIIHPEGSNENNVSFNIGVQAVDADGDVDGATITINVDDDTPFAADDTDTIASGTVGPATGNVITGMEVAVAEDTNSTDGNADAVGADSPGRISFIDNSQNAAAGVVVPINGSTTIAGQFGVLTIFANGDYSYDRTDGSPGGGTEIFTYTLTDFDGDTATATLTIGIGNNIPVATTAAATVDDDGLAGANPAGTNDIDANLTDANAGEPGDTEAIFVGMLGATGGDGDLDFSLVTRANVMIGQELVSFAVNPDGNLLTATIVTSPDATRVGDPLFTVSLNKETGEYTVTLVDNILHGDDANNDEDGIEVQVTLPYQVVDVDGSSSAANGALTVSFNDDVPTARPDLDTIAAGTTGPATGNLITDNAAGDTGDTDTNAADTLGADGARVTFVDNSQNVAVGIAVPASGSVNIAGQFGILTIFANGDYSYARTEGAGGGGQEIFSYTLTDADGDESISTLTIAIANAAPVASTETATVDDDGLLTGTAELGNGNPGGDATNGDDNANLGETPTTNSSEAIYNGTITATGGDGDLDFALVLPAANATIGQETVSFTLVNNVLTATIATSPTAGRVGDPLFTVSLDPESGNYVVTLLDNVQHLTLNGVDGDNSENNTSVVINYQVTDADGSVAAAPGTLTIDFDDDMPSVNAAGNVTLTAGLTSTTGIFDFAIGADDAFTPYNASSFLTTTVTGNVSGQPITVTSPPTYTGTTNGVATYAFAFTYDADPGPSVDPRMNSGTINFDIEDGTYTVTIAQPISGFSTSQTSSVIDRTGYNLEGTPQQSEIVVSELNSPTPLFVQFTGDAASNSNPLLANGDTNFTNGELFTAGQTFVSISNTENGVAGDTIQGGEVLDFNLLTSDPGGVITQPTPGNQFEATGLTIRLDGVGNTEDFVVILKLYDTVTGVYTTRAVIVGAEDVYRNDDAIPAAYDPGLATPANPLDNNDGLVIIEANDYQMGNANLVIVGAQLIASTEDIDGSGIALNGDTGAAGASTTTQFFGDVDNGTTDETNDQDVVKISDIGITRVVTTPQSLSLDFTVNITDSDGDTVTQHLLVNPPPPAMAASTTKLASEGSSDTISSMSLASTSGEDQQLQKAAANNNTVVVAAAVAAAGMAATPAAAESDPMSATATDSEIASGGEQSARIGANDDTVADTSRPLLGNESRVIADDGNDGNGSAAGSAAASKGKLVSDDSVPIAEPADLLAATEGPANDAAASLIAPMLVMPTAEALESLAGTAGAGAQHSGTVEKILAEALEGGAGGDLIATILAQLPSGRDGQNAALDALAIPGGDAVPGWDMGQAGYFQAEALMNIGTDVSAFHHDAVQPVING